MTPDELAKVAKGLTVAQREALAKGKWNVGPVCNHLIGKGMVKRVGGAGVLMNIEITPLGQAVAGWIRENEPCP